MARQEENGKSGARRGPVAFLKSLLFHPSARYGTGVLIIVGMAIGIVGWTGMMTVVEASSSDEFCASCHEMQAFVFPEYEMSSHQNNRSGVGAECRDCHVPEGFLAKMRTKIKATLIEVPSHLAGTISTEEKFEQHKLAMAEKVWTRMRADDSRACRSCHSYEIMEAELQSRTAQRSHSADSREKTGKTCIDCHAGIVHSLPERAAG
ncbi:MAG: NapC/NirT family cytochrome c [Wenzhouxiangellaceae bacterium]